MITREQVLSYVQQQYGVIPDYPWEKYPNYVALRHQKNGKWFALIMDITADKLGIDSDKVIDVVNVKVEKEFIGSLRQKQGVYEAYHMNKANWVTLYLEELRSIDELIEFIEASYQLTK
ncbi:MULTISPECIES: MmcQ/YjbR family DNA-binding protein [unclassified Staphylococcus]|uniref:MmcQ/YjbR family DNA-binding protein n=1 Tax=unclassified Staphylococcus TaxID=91994 RepID=UPI0021CE169F|nr:MULTISPECIES: MmcQ/YjbR family DNA-binding protein [unclassified Staphylococcus]UXR69227.1 MmcQ/YjbR family DNA-binding protein [Staphylococcus sp. IVB6246]UXR71280.1 MmcQ/YjbR family DNA-binding protein [Staphylococcus sp. IVB6240]UXR75872.1 MmcQ/YjbR family DNA-binding protein [Staphylococcus sp. IVB6233]UXR80069.1 MmcQ/YjbR family DNA-binding protein [Staphylococcus sp. IVB6218]